MVTARKLNDGLFQDLWAKADANPLPFSLTRIGDCEAPAMIATAVYAGHRYAQELDIDRPLRHDRTDVGKDALEIEVRLKSAAE